MMRHFDDIMTPAVGQVFEVSLAMQLSRQRLTGSPFQGWVIILWQTDVPTFQPEYDGSCGGFQVKLDRLSGTFAGVHEEALHQVFNVARRRHDRRQRGRRVDGQLSMTRR